MKKLMFLLAVISISLIGCGSESESSAVKSSEEPASLPVITVDTAKEAEGSSESESGQAAMQEVSQESAVSDDAPGGYQVSANDTAENGVYVISTNTPGEVNLIFGGDIDFDPGYSNMRALAGRGNDISKCLSPELIADLKNADICMLNNEFPYSDRGAPTANKKYTFRADPSSVNYLHELGVDIVSLANNHAYDYGPDALMDTFTTLENAGIPYVGAGRNLADAEKPVYFIAGGMKIAYVSATQIERTTPPDTKEATDTEPGVLRTLDPSKFVSVIENAKANADFVIVYVHWGTENKNQYEASQKELAQAYVQAGADLIMGDHPHVLQGFEYIDNVPVLYSLGNFWFNSKALDNCAVKVTLKDKAISSEQFIPCMQHNCYTEMLNSSSGDYARVIAEMRSYSADNVSIDDSGFISIR